MTACTDSNANNAVNNAANKNVDNGVDNGVGHREETVEQVIERRRSFRKQAREKEKEDRAIRNNLEQAALSATAVVEPRWVSSSCVFPHWDPMLFPYLRDSLTDWFLPVVLSFFSNFFSGE